ncbi:Iron-sulfur cluster assembly protein SufD [Lysobacter dokdonensis DS-58]|uniref:Iron-sulfur cluster assembly protein SufD n=1 Tax=Lysobacter dokdonensis DS-58 TaxID=1300345 RepID=A0A0A2WGA5_9GAMM|nr:Fe-S cluster assembly protein SufD [Lysobacter dokdonensis]KGQ17732.1 Iron-sulfur cluster assembly protein SufD [Lysobacter dokdonensis DS-58]
MSALLESLAQGFDGDAARRETLDAALRDGLPKPRSEAWKYTSLRALERRVFAPAQSSPVDATIVAAIDGPRIVFVNGVFDATLSSLDALPAGVTLQAGSVADPLDVGGPDRVFASLNAALARTGVVLHVAANAQVAVPLHLVFIGAAAAQDQAWHLRHAIEIGERASAALIEHHVASGAHSHLGNSLTTIRVARGASLTHVRVQDDAVGATLFARTDASLDADARYRRLDLELGGALSRHEFGCRLLGANAAVQSDGVLLGTGRRHIDTRLNIDHVAGDTRCDLTWRGLAADRSRAVLHGGILIRAGADGSNAALSSRNLLLSDNAEIDAQPVLEIHADEVQAAHGAAVGGLDPTALFYLRSRGLPEGDARRLLTTAFCRDVLAGLDAALRPAAESALDRALAMLERTA